MGPELLEILRRECKFATTQPIDRPVSPCVNDGIRDRSKAVTVTSRLVEVKFG